MTKILATRVMVMMAAGIGHDFQLHRNRAESWEGIDAWIRQNVRR